MTKSRPFSTYSSASVAVGILAAATSLLPAIEELSGRGLWGTSIFFVGSVLLMLPGIVMRSWKRILGGFVAGFILVPAMHYVGLAFWVNGRETLPLTLFLTPGVGVATPYYDDIPLGWEARSVVGFVVFWFIIDMISLRMREGATREGSKQFIQSVKQRAATYVPASLISSLIVLILYPLSWGGKLSGTFHRPIHGLHAYVVSLAVFGLIFPAKLWCLNYLHYHLVRRGTECARIG